jgi:hypothetical protein
MPRPVALAAIALLIGCNHTEPFSTPSNGTDQPFNPSPPVQLTLNDGVDRIPAWLPDGSGILYAAQQRGTRDHDHCLALLSASGGRQQSLWCNYPTGAEWTDAFLSAAVAPDGRFAFLAGSSTINGSNPEILGIRLSATVDPWSATVIRRIPYPGAGANVTAAAQLRWLGSGQLAFLAQRVRYRKECSGCTADTLLATLDVALISLADPEAMPIPVPGTARATGIAPIEGDGALLYTLAGDSRVFRHQLATGAVEVVHDFGSAGIARDPHLAGNRLAVVVGGVVGTEVDPEIGTIQWDSGGVIHLFDLADGSDVPLVTTETLYRRPALSPAGDKVVAEGYRYTVTQTQDPVSGQVVVDTVMHPDSDLFLIEGSR